VLGAINAYGAIQTALLQRVRTGVGQHVDVALMDSMLNLLVYELQEAQFPVPTPRPTYGPVRAADGDVLVVPITARNFAALCEVTGLPEHRIVKLGRKENYWSMGVPGPGGPCSEILYDRGPAYGADGDFNAEDRYLEIWNLVFMQDELSAVRSKEDFDIAGSLPKQNIDTGMGLERVAFLLQDKQAWKDTIAFLLA